MILIAHPVWEREIHDFTILLFVYGHDFLYYIVEYGYPATSHPLPLKKTQRKTKKVQAFHQVSARAASDFRPHQGAIGGFGQQRGELCGERDLRTGG